MSSEFLTIVCLKMEDSQSLGNLITKLHHFIYPENQLRVFRFFCPAFISHISMSQFVTISMLAGFLSCLLPYTLSAQRKHELPPLACLNMSNLKTKQKADTASASSCNSKPCAPLICTFQAGHRCEDCAISCLFICGLLKDALDNLEFVT
jgi:hypothetical protein